MKFTINLNFLKKTSFVFFFLLNLSIIFSLKSEDLDDLNVETDFDPDIEEAINEESKNIEAFFDAYNLMEMGSVAKNNTNTIKSKYIVDLKSPKGELNGWLAVSNTKFIDPNIFPSEISESNDTVDFKKVEGGSFIVNKNFPNKDEKELKNKYSFYFHFKNGLVYFTGTKKSVNVLASLKPINAENNFYSYPNSKNSTLSCFNLKDESGMTWNLCADNIKTKYKWLCSLENYTGSYLDSFCLPENSGNKNKQNSTSSNKKGKRFRKLLIIPTETRKCNANWNYKQFGNDWECTCAEGKHQSPIDLPSKNKALPTRMKPLFIYENVHPLLSESTIDGLLVQNENLKIFYKSGALRIFHSYMGKIVTIDGGVYHSEEIVIHTPAEHTIEGKKFAMEVQIIHYGKSKGDISKQVVLSFLFYEKPGVFNKFFEKLDYYNLPNEIDDFKDLREKFFIPELFYNNEEGDINFTKDFSFYSYEGSLTFPPCTERTTYFIAATPIPISSTVIGMFKEALRKPDYISGGKIIKSYEQPKLNNRKIQDRNGRKITYYQSKLKGI